MSSGVGGARVLATGESAEAEVDFKYALIGTALGVAICVGFLVLKICMIRKHLSDQDSAELRSTARGVTDPFVQRKKRSLSMRLPQRGHGTSRPVLRQHRTPGPLTAGDTEFGGAAEEVTVAD
ncbi:transmembrane protein 273 isoform X3 [Cavia porcellus]|uniref:transmembrane protein 273 isoform X3 n=1 Tax=Cavia porcellus TaxID=10141 RepID=UPI002FE1BB85